MAVPARRVSKTRKRKRRTHFKLKEERLIKCSHCGELIQSHCVCKYCGYYNEKLIIKIKKNDKNNKNNKKSDKQK